MSGKTIDKAVLIKAALALFDEAYADPKPGASWFSDGGQGTGFLGTLEGLSAAEASRPLSQGDSLSLASHVDHLRFSLSLANRASKGENPYKDANWARSWDARGVDEKTWKSLVAALRSEYEAYRTVIASEGIWDDGDSLTGNLGLIVHGAWHLGAIRQGLGLVKAPKA